MGEGILVKVPSELASCNKQGLEIDLKDAIYCIEHQVPVSGHGRSHGMMAWRDRVLGSLMRSSMLATANFQSLDSRVGDPGLRVGI